MSIRDKLYVNLRLTYTVLIYTASSLLCIVQQTNSTSDLDSPGLGYVQTSSNSWRLRHRDRVH